MKIMFKDIYEISHETFYTRYNFDVYGKVHIKSVGKKILFGQDLNEYNSIQLSKDIKGAIEYQKELNNIKLNGGLASAGSGEIVRRLKQESRLFQTTLEKHHRFIKAKKTLSENMIKDISMEVTNQNGSSNKYGRDAKMSQKSVVSKTTSLAINKTI